MLLSLLVVLSLPLVTPAPDALPSPKLNAPTTGGVQLAVGGAACLAVGALNSVPLVGPIVSTLIAGVVVAGAETATGDALGPSRSALLWPVLTSTTIFVAGGVTSVLWSTMTAYSTSEAVYAIVVGGPVQTAIGVATGIVGVTAPMLVYHLTAIPKAPDDLGGLSMPGILVPADPSNSRDPPATTPAVSPHAPPPAVELIY